jgi:hypothetical protein
LRIAWAIALTLMDLRRRGGRSIPDRLAPLATRAILTPPRQHCSPLHELTRPRVSIRTAPRHQPFSGPTATCSADRRGPRPESLAQGLLPAHGHHQLRQHHSSWRACLKVNSHNNVGIAEGALTPSDSAFIQPPPSAASALGWPTRLDPRRADIGLSPSSRRSRSAKIITGTSPASRLGRFIPAA